MIIEFERRNSDEVDRQRSKDAEINELRITIQRLEVTIRDLEKGRSGEGELLRQKDVEISQLRITIQNLEAAIRDFERRWTEES